MIDIERTLRLLDVEAESNFVQADAIDAINYLLGENARLQEENDAWRMDGGSCAEEVKRLREENARLAALSAKASLEASQLREALKPFARAAEYCEGLGDLDHKSVLVENFRAAAAAIREGGKDDAP